MSNGVDAMKAARERRGKPAPRHPRPEQGGEQVDSTRQEQAHEPAQDAAENSASGESGGQPPPSPPTRQGNTQRRSGRSSGGEASNKGKGSPEPEPEPGGGAVGQAQGKQVSDVALGWAAAARKLSERAELVRQSVEVARAAGTPEHTLLSALKAAEYRAGTSLPDEVWHAAEIDGA